MVPQPRQGCHECKSPAQVSWPLRFPTVNTDWHRAFTITLRGLESLIRLVPLERC